MRYTIFIFLLLPAFLWGQYPNNPRKLRLGTQTTGAGLTYIQSGAPSHTPADDEDAWMVLDTANNALYYYDEAAGAWENILDDVVRDTVFRITSVPDTSTIVPLQGDLFVNTTADTLGAYDGAGWQLFFGGSGSGGTTHDTTAYFHRRLTFGTDYTLPSAVLDTADIISIYAGAQTGTSITITLPTLSDTTYDGKIIYVMGSGTENGDIMRITSPDSTDILVQGCGAGSVTGPDTITTSYRVLYQYIISNGRYYRTCQRANVNSITSVPDTTNIDAHQGDMFVNSTADTLGLYSGTGWVLFYGGGGNPGVSTVTLSNLTLDTVDFNSIDHGIFHIETGAVSNDTIYFSGAVDGGNYTLDLDNVTTDTLKWPDNLLDANEDTVGTRIYTAGKFISFYYDGINYYTPQALGSTLVDTSASPADTLLLNNYGGAWGAYALRKLDGSYSGSAIQVTRSSDETQQLIGFVSTVHLDTATLNTFCSGTDCYVTRWYDQSGNNNDFIQSDTTNAPLIVQAGTILRDNGLPSLHFDGTNDRLSGSSNSSQSGWVFSVFNDLGTTTTLAAQANPADDSEYTILSASATSGQNYSARFSVAAGLGTSTVRYGADSILNTQSLVTYASDATNYSMFINGTSQSLSILAGTIDGQWWGDYAYTMYLAALVRLSSTAYSELNAQELIIYNSSQSSNRTAIETNINGHYSIY